MDPRDIAVCIEDDATTPADGPAPMAAPLVQTSLFAFPHLDALNSALAAEHDHPVYSRGRNPTVAEFERKLAALEHGEECIAFGSGMAAISAVLMGTLRAGDHVLFVNHTYGPTVQLAKELARFGIAHDLMLRTDPAEVRGALRPNTRLVWLESPGTMMFRTLDIAAIATVAREHGALTCLDNSWATPLFQKPLDAGVDLVVHSATKYLGGHSDVVAGALVGARDLVLDIFRRAYMLHGAVLAPFHAWLLLRGMRTLPVRLRQHERDAREVADWLRAHPRVARVFHPAFNGPLPATLTGTSGVFAFELADAGYPELRTFVDALTRFRIGVSWGGVESLVITPNRGTNLDHLDAQRIPHGLVRLSIGLEGADALIADLATAFDAT